jgi:signal peptidase I
VFKQKGTGEALIKRVIGLPNETVRIADGKIYIDEKEITDVKNTDVPEDAGSAQNGLKLSAGEYFVLGDNRKESIDSRYDQVGIVSSTKITGRMFMRLSPLTKIKFF